MKNILSCLLVIVIFGVIFIVVILYIDELVNYVVVEPEPKPHTIVELQLYLGVEPDGVIGPNTITAYEQYSFNENAAPFHTETGAPEK